jgi:glycosyltransferase involved in cell wall biosynthesis
LILDGEEIKSTTKYMKYWFKSTFAFPDRHNGWYPIAIKEAKNVLENDKIDLILSTSSPWTSALVARRLSVLYGIPWIADFRDLWSQNHRHEFNRIRVFCDRILEKWTLKQARRLVIVSSDRAKKWKQILGDRDIRAITLGYDEESFSNSTAETSPSSEFSICYAGKIKGKQDPGPLFAAMSELIHEGTVNPGFFRCFIFGEVEQWVRDLVERYGLQANVLFMSRVPREEIVDRMQRSTLLLNLNWNDPDETGIHPGKLFDYLGARRPILSVGSQRDVVQSVLEETQAGVQLWDTQAVKAFLVEQIAEFRSLGQVSYRGDPVAVERYGYKSITARFVNLMNEVVSEN